jgi:hypothetical protein
MQGLGMSDRPLQPSHAAPAAAGAPTDRPRAGRFEVLGAWLHVWTPPRGVEIPPVPWRKIGLGGVVAAVALAGLAIWLVPRIEEAKRHYAQTQQRQTALAVSQDRRRLRSEQRLHRVRAVRLPAAGSPAALHQRATVLVSDLEASITADARARAKARELDGPIARTECRPYPAGSQVAQRASGTPPSRYSCVAVTGDIHTGTGKFAGVLGYPFWARLDVRAGTYLWCRINPNPGETAVGSALATVALPRPCNLAAG